ncbi:PKD domain-containing protein [Allobranchiibius sp. CTAmp26]|uniref:PKD domain-containing protein n=1 Tax=Allobranchiibius sp. CTAmp26 TaxID=2815214 RepID=UPI001AA16E12|nr:PKD domain-containing protein [Allobranchiibius sp. CTAmp26]MBO1756823.1 PKD domain-containing protein [Allobranchiibius sp. CTAmp26]
MTAFRTALSQRLTRLIAMTIAMVLLTFGMVIVSGATPARADTDPPAGTPATVSDDALPTWQINGVVWSQVTIGNTVYAAGEFSQARPPGVPVGGAGSVNVGNLIAYDITTGNLITSFNHILNAQALVITKSPDNSRIYVGGDFTTVDGQARAHIAAFDVATGALNASFHPSTDQTIKAITATNSTVYAGGQFASASGAPRARLAAFNASNGALLPWAPKSDGNYVWTMIMTPDQSKVVIGGQFQYLNGQETDGLAAVDPVSGSLVPWAASTKIPDALNGAIMGLSTDGTSIYGSGFAFGSGASFEGEFSLNPADGSINWLNDCQGDTYNTYPMNGALYTVSHVHNCEMIGGLTQLSDWSINQKHALAFSTTSSGQNDRGPDQYGWNYSAYQYSKLLTWYPNFLFGSYTKQKQSGWSITGNGDYLAIGGEFPAVNGKAQYGLTRFAVKSKAPNKMGPAACYAAPAPSALAVGGGSARVSWQAATDPDNANLTYKVYRSGTSAPIYTTTQSNEYWNCPQMGYRDTGLTGGTAYTYKITASDSSGNTYTLPTTNSVTPASGATSKYDQDVVNDGAGDFWTLGEPSGSTVYDNAGFNDATAQSDVTRGASGPITGDPTTATTFGGSSNGFVATNSTVPVTPALSVEAWIKTTTTSGGKIVGYGDSNTGNSGSYDRHIYMDNAGHVIWGVYPGSVQVVQSPKTYNDGTWHHIVASLDPTAGMALYVDGKKVGANTNATSGQPYSGYWKIGGDNLGSWYNQPSSNYFAGTIGDVAIYPTALSLAQVQTHFTDGGGTLTGPSAPTDAYGKAVYNSNPDLFWRLDDTSGSTAADASRNGETGAYSGGTTLGQPGALGAQGTAVTFNGTDGTIGSADPVSGPSVYSEELWFNTTTTSGGKLIGFGDQQSGNSSNYDRHVYMTADGRLNFGVWTGQANVITSPNSYNDGKWHHMVATQGPDGMTLYVDGQGVASGSQTQAQPYTGYWRVGGDSSWADSNYFAGTIDEAAVYSTELSASTVQAHYLAGGGTLPNQSPVAAFTSSASNLTGSFDGSGSTDPDGTVASYSWNYGDGTTAGSGVSPTHAYTAAGTYTVTLTVTDNQGATNSVSHNITVTAPPVNQSPVAAFTSSASNLTGSFDGSGSTDPDGTVASYSWNYGDGTTAGSGVSPTHAYTAAGTYTVTLTVTDNQGATNSVSHNITVTAPPVNQPPVAAFTSSASNLTGSFDGSGSTDPDGTVASYSWNYGDGSTAGSGVQPSHVYAAAGTYTVTLTVTDNQGATNSVSHNITVTAPVNQPPVAAFTSSASNLTGSFDGSGSTDPDGTVASYAWNYGDGTAAGTGAKPSHVYAAAGTYNVTLTVTDNQGATNSVSHSITVTAPVNQPPVAAFTSSVSNLTGSFDGSGSSDPDGTVASYSWNYGDGTTAGTGAKPSHVYAAAGTYNVTLTVTDNQGATNSVSHPVTVSQPAPVTLASDDFQRTVASGWGSLDSGGAWTTSGSGLSVNGNVGLLATAKAGGSSMAWANGISSSNSDVRVQFSMDSAPTGGGMYVYVVGRRVTGVGDYRAKVWLRSDGKVGLAISRMDGTTEVAAVPLQTISGLTYTPGTMLNVRFDATGTSPTTLQAKVWASGTTEPATWQVQTTDATAALQVRGGVGLGSFLSGTATTLPVTLSFDTLRVYDATTLNAQQMKAMAKGVPTQRLQLVTKANAAKLHAVSRWSKP